MLQHWLQHLRQLSSCRTKINNKKKTKKPSMASVVVVGVGARHTNGGSDSPRQVEDAAALAAASLAVVVL